LSEEDSFRTLIRRVRDGDAQAAAELVRRYEPAIRLTVRVRLTDPRLRRVLDSMDICQSVFGSFFARVASGQYNLDTPDQVKQLLTTMAWNKLQNHQEKQKARRRDCRRLQDTPDADKKVVDPGSPPDEIVISRELLEEIRNRLTPEERYLAEQRAMGHSWKEIAAAVGGQPNALRMQHKRALDRVLRELGLEE
jgi:RNA polymerase sigma-70 factor (ECF subfamily)